MSQQTHVRMVHTKTGQEWDAPAGYVARAQQKGYRVVGAAGPYDEKTVEDLKAEIDTRNTDRPEEEQLSKSGNKNDLIATLTADDGRRS